MKREITSLVIGIAVIIFVGGIFGCSKLKEKVKVSEIEKPEVNKTYERSVQEKETLDSQTADWKTYRDEKYKFEIKYPQYYVVERYEPKRKRYYKFLISFFDKKWKEIKIHHPGAHICVIETELSPKEWLYSDENPSKEYKESGQSDLDLPHGFTNVRQSTVNGGAVLQYRVLGASGCTDYTLFQGKGNILYNTGAHSCGNGIFPEDIYNQMLSTFRFLE